MSKNRFESSRTLSADDAAEYLTSLAAGLKRGEVTLDAGDEKLTLMPAADLKLALNVRQKSRKSRILVELWWKRRSAPSVADLKIQSGLQLASSGDGPRATRGRGARSAS